MRKKGTKNAPGKKPGPKGGLKGRNGGRTETVKEADREQIAYLMRMGFSQSEIAKEIGLSEGMISIESKKIRQRALDSMIEDRKAMIYQEYQVLMDVRKKAELALRLSEKGKKKTYSESGTSDKGAFGKDGESHEELLPPSEYMNVILKSNERICEMFDLDEAVKTILNVNINNKTVNIFDQMMEKMLGSAIKEGTSGSDAQTPSAILDTVDGEILETKETS